MYIDVHFHHYHSSFVWWFFSFLFFFFFVLLLLLSSLYYIYSILYISISIYTYIYVYIYIYTCVQMMYRWCVLHLRQAEAGEDGMAKIEAAEAAKRSDVSSGRVWIVPLKWLCFDWEFESNSQLPGSHLGHFEAAFQSTLISIWRSWKAWDAHGHHPLRMSGSPHAPSTILACSWMIEQSWSWW